MALPAQPPSSLHQRVWDMAAGMADRGAAQSDIVAGVLASHGPQIDAEITRTIPARGKVFWSSVVKAVGWAVVAILAVLGVGSTGAHPVPGLTLAICLSALLFGSLFGVVAGNHKVRERRFRADSALRTAYERLAAEAAHRVWAAQVPGRWQPLGPAPDAPPVPGVSERPAAWIRRFGAESSELAAAPTDGTVNGLRRDLRAAGSVPVALFVAEPGGFTDEARSCADDCGVTLFVVGAARIYSMSAVASRALSTYRDPRSTRSPAAVIIAAWSEAAARREAALGLPVTPSAGRPAA